MRRREFAGALAAPLLAQPISAQQRPRPNIVFVLVDDLRWDALGATGLAWARTPNIDRLAREGMSFRNAFVTTPLCSPARASFLTGQYARKHGVVGNTPAGEPISHKLVTFPKLLHDAGYETAYVGKWHMGTDDSPRPGFDRWVSFKGQGVYENPPLNIDGKQIEKSGYMTDILSDFAAEFLEARHEKPFCLYVSHKAVHGPFTPAPRHKDLFAGDVPPPRPNRSGPQERHLEIARNQMRCMVSIDEGVGRMYAALEKSGQLDNTIFVFTSDNGYFWGEHGFGDKRWAYDESLRIPLIVRYPALVPRGSRSSALALNVDIAPTALHLAGVEVPKGMHGRSLKEPLRGNLRTWRTSFLAEYFKEERFPNTPTWQAVRSARHKYVRYPNGERPDELFDLVKDPYERTNLATSGAAKPFLDRMKLDLEAKLRQTA